jgi:hypothetical protein
VDELPGPIDGFGGVASVMRSINSVLKNLTTGRMDDPPVNGQPDLLERRFNSLPQRYHKTDAAPMSFVSAPRGGRLIRRFSRLRRF